MSVQGGPLPLLISTQCLDESRHTCTLTVEQGEFVSKTLEKAPNLSGWHLSFLKAWSFHISWVGWDGIHILCQIMRRVLLPGLVHTSSANLSAHRTRSLS